MAYGYVRNKDLKPTDWSAVTKVITDRFEKAETEQKKKDTTKETDKKEDKKVASA